MEDLEEVIKINYDIIAAILVNYLNLAIYLYNLGISLED